MCIMGVLCNHQSITMAAAWRAPLLTSKRVFTSGTSAERTCGCSYSYRPLLRLQEECALRAWSANSMQPRPAREGSMIELYCELYALSITKRRPAASFHSKHSCPPQCSLDWCSFHYLHSLIGVLFADVHFIQSPLFFTIIVSVPRLISMVRQL